MGTATSTGTLTAGNSRTFNLAPASAVTLTLLPNCRVTITESPATVDATALGGNATRVHEPRLPGTFTYGPYPMGGSVVVANESNSGSTVTWVETGATYSKDTSGNVTGLVGPDGSRVRLSNVPNNDRYAGYELSTFYSRPSTDYQVVGAGSSIATSTAVTRTGSQTLKVTCNRGSATNTDINVLHSWTNYVTFAGRVGIWVYVPDFTLLTSFVLKVSHGDTAYTNGAFQTYSFADGDHKFNGWHFVGYDKAEFTGSYGTPDWTAVVGAVRLTINQNSATAVDVYLDSMLAGWRSKAKILITQDDGYRNWFDLGLPILDSLGLTASMSIIGSQIGSNDTWATSAQLAAAYANGHDLCVHGATNLTSLADDAARRADVASNLAYLTSRGYTRGSDFYVWPNGAFALSDGDYSLIQILLDLGFKAARGTTTPRFAKHASGLPDVKFLLPVIGVAASDSVSTVTGLIDSACTYGATAFLMYHELKTSAASGGTQRNVSDFMREMEHLAAKRDAGLCDVVGVSYLTSAIA